MAIEVICSNGHALKVKDKYAGKAGLCPRCHVRVDVPAADEFPDDHVLADAGVAPVFKPSRSPSDGYADQDMRHDGESVLSGVSLLGSSIVRRKKVCPECGKEASFSFTFCPSCASPLSNSLAPT